MIDTFHDLFSCESYVYDTSGDPYRGATGNHLGDNNHCVLVVFSIYYNIEVASDLFRRDSNAFFRVRRVALAPTIKI